MLRDDVYVYCYVRIYLYCYVRIYLYVCVFDGSLGGVEGASRPAEFSMPGFSLQGVILGSPLLVSSSEGPLPVILPRVLLTFDVPLFLVH